tara:strand:+ start:108 stop:545 length:438 start_codon:yes stop_codon:yes gene_type:complete
LINPNKLGKKDYKPCSFLRRLGAILYDSILLFAVLMFATSLLMPLNGVAIESDNAAYQIYLLIIAYIYFVWQWSFGGRTLGMRTWNIKIMNEKGENPSWHESTKRYFGSILSIILLGSGFLWSLFDHKKCALHDHLSKTTLIIKK